MVATIVTGDSTISIQQRVEDAWFTSVVVTPMGSDRVFLHCTRGDDIWQVFNSAIDLFSMLFSNLHNWTLKDEYYERGVWLRVYGVPTHARNEAFFKIYVLKSGRFLRADACTVDKARLDFARVLISTSCLEMVNMSSDILIDGCKHSINMVNEWGCNLGEDSFLAEEETESRTEVLYGHNDVPVLDEVQGEVDALVNDLNKDWSQFGSKQKKKDFVDGVVSQEECLGQLEADALLRKEEQHLPKAEAVQVRNQKLAIAKALAVSAEDLKVHQYHRVSKKKRDASCNVNPSISNSIVPWSLDWLSQLPKPAVKAASSSKNIKIISHDYVHMKTAPLC